MGFLGGEFPSNVEKSPTVQWQTKTLLRLEAIPVDFQIFRCAQQIVFDKFALHVKRRWSDSTLRSQIRM